MPNNALIISVLSWSSAADCLENDASGARATYAFLLLFSTASGTIPKRDRRMRERRWPGRTSLVSLGNCKQETDKPRSEKGIPLGSYRGSVDGYLTAKLPSQGNSMWQCCPGLGNPPQKLEALLVAIYGGSAVTINEIGTESLWEAVSVQEARQRSGWKERPSTNS